MTGSVIPIPAGAGDRAKAKATVDLRRLRSFVKVVDLGSITRAADVLHVAQPALSQQILSIERLFGQPLLVRGKSGVTPTKAGRIAYRHAQVMLRQLEQARSEVRKAGDGLQGRVTVGVVPYSSASGLVLALMQEVADRYPQILLHIHENFEGVLAEELLQGRMDMAFLYELSARPGLLYSPLNTEPLCIVAARGTAPALAPGQPVDPVALADFPLLLPSRIHAIRQMVEAYFEANQVKPRVLAEIESLETLGAAVREGLGGAILPALAARAIADCPSFVVRRLLGEATELMLFLCAAESHAPSEAVLAVHDLAADLAGRRLTGGSPVAARATSPDGA
jgi:LysR family nitrogen assimilation transcriptional regulator